MNGTNHPGTADCLLQVAGALTLRLVGATPEQRGRVARQLSAKVVEHGTPQITVRFAERVGAGPISRQGLTHTGWHGEDFYLLDRGTGAPRASLPFGELTGGVEMTCAHTERNVPGLAELVRLKLLDRGMVTAHASAVTLDGRGVVPMGWAKGGKTGAVLAFARHGAAFVGDEWIAFGDDGTTMVGLGRSIRVADRHVGEFPALSSRAGTGRQLVWRIGRGLETRRIVSLRSVMPRITGRFAIQAREEEIFAVARSEAVASPDVLFLMINADVDDVRVEPTAPGALAQRMAAVGQFERSVLNRWYEAFCFAFPGRRDAAIESATERERAMLGRVFADKHAFAVTHRHPGPLEPLYEAMVRVVR